MLSDEEWALVAKRLKLSPRELQVARGIFDGRKDAHIAAELNISPHTLHTHCRRIKQKLLVTSRTHLIHLIYAQINNHRVAEATERTLVLGHDAAAESNGAGVEPSGAAVRLTGASGRPNAATGKANGAIAKRNRVSG